ncbi:MAG TPA: ornithine cyclodeaminase family protein [Fimbriiglobus sp.]|jgi:ornithine cyclodeaminase/alanine dehydrogenase-like protein (mu-crystallin family)
MNVLYLTEADVRGLLTMDLALEAVEAAFRKISLDEAVNVPRQRCQTDHVVLHVLPAAAKTLGAIGFKVYTTGWFPATFHVHLFDPKHGGPVAILEADFLGQVRTGAATGVATKKLARADAATVGVIGSGKQARTQLEAVCKVRKISKASVYSRDPTKRAAFAAESAKAFGVDVVPVDSAEAAVRDHDVVCTITNSRDPVLKGEWLAPGTHVNLAGSNFLAKAEADAEVFRRARLVTVDSKEQAKAEAGDFVAAMRENALQWSDVKDFAHVLVGRYPGRESKDDITVFKSLGLGIEDIAVAVRVVELANNKGIGRKML